MVRRAIILAILTSLAGLGLELGCAREVALLTPPPAPTATSTLTFTPTFTNTPTVTATPTSGGGPAATATPSGAVMFENFDAGGAEGVYTNNAPPNWLASMYVQGTTTEAVTCVTSTSKSSSHSLECTVNFDASSDLAEVGIASWSSWGGTINASAATNNYSFWVRATGPVTIANVYLCQSGCFPEIGNSGVNFFVPGDSLWHNFVVPIGTGTPPAPWTFANGAAPWNNNPMAMVFFDMVGPPGSVVVNFDDMYFYP